ncbi:GNAT family N-acetyltransferase [Nocardioides conyzicola]|uniref:GNAT family N-acetyltransferase n=1 Tax=Nocardioides conyzicola TaxID=1651781 RepID=A0ABP8XKZ9_9ACTN
MTALEIDPLDPFDPVAYDAFYDVYLAAERAAGDVGAPWMREEVRVDLQEPVTRRWIGAFVGRVGGRAVAVGQLSTPLLDNLGSASVAVHVAPDSRRRGHGSALLARLEAEAAVRGRHLLNAEAAWAYDSGPSGAGEPGPEFARAHGFALGLGDVKRRLELPVAAGLLDQVAAEVAPHHAAYELRSWVGPVPDELVTGWATLDASLVTEAPTGELLREPEAVDPAVVREGEAMLARQGRTKFNSVALDADGEVVAYSDLVTTVHEPGRAYQWGTLVRSDARGHRLGLAVKVANLRQLQERRPDIRELITYNAEVNAHMIGVNERLGFIPVARLGEFQKRT